MAVRDVPTTTPFTHNSTRSKLSSLAASVKLTMVRTTKLPPFGIGTKSGTKSALFASSSFLLNAMWSAVVKKRNSLPSSPAAAFAGRT